MFWKCRVYIALRVSKGYLPITVNGHFCEIPFGSGVKNKGSLPAISYRCASNFSSLYEWFSSDSLCSGSLGIVFFFFNWHSLSASFIITLSLVLINLELKDLLIFLNVERKAGRRKVMQKHCFYNWGFDINGVSIATGHN